MVPVLLPTGGKSVPLHHSQLLVSPALLLAPPPPFLGLSLVIVPHRLLQCQERGRGMLENSRQQPQPRADGPFCVRFRECRDGPTGLVGEP